MLETLICSAAIAVNGLIGATRPAVPGSALIKDARHPVIVHVVSRNQTVTVKASRGGMLYSVTATDGKIILADATADKFAALQPQLYKQFRQATASTADANAPIAIGSIAE